MRNKWIDQYRHRQRLPTECLTDNFDDWEWRACGRHGKVDHGGVDTASIRQACGGLPEALQRALYIAYVEGLPHKEIAHIECIPFGMVMSRLHRARHRLRARLAELEIGSSPRSTSAPSAKLTDLASQKILVPTSHRLSSSIFRLRQAVSGPTATRAHVASTPVNGDHLAAEAASPQNRKRRSMPHTPGPRVGRILLERACSHGHAGSGGDRLPAGRHSVSYGGEQ